MEKPSLVVLISGSGSNLQAIIDATRDGTLNADIKAVISNNATAQGLQRASDAGIDCHVVDHKQFDSREAFDQQMIDIIDRIDPALVILAGFMRILSKHFIVHYRHRLLNIHPSLLPRYKGLNTHRKAIDNQDETHGASVHYVDYELDSGPVVLQAEVPIQQDDSAEALAARVLKQEHQIYPLAIQLHLDGRLAFREGRLFLDDKVLSKPLLWKNNKLVE